MNRNTTEDWLILLCFSWSTKEKFFTKIFKNIKEINIVLALIDLVQSVEASVEQSNRLLGKVGQVRYTGRNTQDKPIKSACLSGSSVKEEKPY